MLFPGGSVFPCGKFSAALLVGRQDAQIVCHADLVTDCTELTQGIGILPQFSSIHITDRVDYEVGMDMLGIAVSADLYLISRPRFLSELSGDLMRLLWRDVFPGMEGLHVLVEIDAVYFIIGSLRCQKFCNGIAAIAVDAADQFLS